MSLPNLSHLCIAVIGDAMLDRYVEGTAQRISPEAPVPVVLQRQITDLPGGAANVAANISALGARTELVTLIGHDVEAEALSQSLKGLRIGLRSVAALPCTVLKTRIMAGRQQLVRIDREVVLTSISPNKTEELFAQAFAAMSKASVLVLSDYAKGTLSSDVCTRLITRAKERGLPSVIDPKHADWTRYMGADLITPNLKELGEAVGQDLSNTDSDVTVAARVLLDKYVIGAVLVTRSEKGMSYISRTEAVHSPATAREVFDVTGAGDTVLAMVALLMALPMGWAERLQLANVAAGIAVGHVGTARVTYKEVADALVPSPKGNFLIGEALLAEIQELRADGKKIVLTNGCYDVLHRGHVSLLEQAAALGEVLLVALNTDDSVRRLKGPTRPINTLDDRAFILSRLSSVSIVTSFDEDTPEQLIASVKPDVLVKGGDYALQEVVGREHAGRTVIIPLVAGHSSTRIIEKGGVL